MSLIICGDCQKEYSNYAIACPKCARPTISQTNLEDDSSKKGSETIIETEFEEDSNINSQNLKTSSDSNESSLENNCQFIDSEEDKGLGNIKLGPKGIYTEAVSYTHLTLPTT